MFRQNFRSFFAVSVLAAVMFLVAQLITGPVPEAGQPVPSPMRFVASSILQLVGFTFLAGTISIMAGAAYIGDPIDAQAAMKRTGARFWILIALGVIVWAAVGIGFVLLIVPGLYLLAKFGLAPTLAAIENTGVRASLARAAALSEGQKKHVLATLCLSLAIIFVTFFAIGAITALLNPIVVHLLSAVVMVFVYPLAPIAAAILFYDLRVRNEGLDIEMMSARLEQARPA